MSESNQPITGKILFRDNAMIGVPPEKKIVTFVGVMIVPADAKISHDHQYNLCGEEDGNLEITNLTIQHSTEKDLTAEGYNQSLSDMLSFPIWRM